MNETAIKKLLGEATKKILDELNNTKNELKRVIDSTKPNLLLKIEEQTQRVKKLEAKNLSLKDRIEELDIKSSANNVVVFGIKKTNRELKLNVQELCREVNKVLKVHIKESDVNNVYPLDNNSYSLEDLREVPLIEAQKLNSAPATPNSLRMNEEEQITAAEIEIEKQIFSSSVQVNSEPLFLANNLEGESCKPIENKRNCYDNEDNIHNDGLFAPSEDFMADVFDEEHEPIISQISLSEQLITYYHIIPQLKPMVAAIYCGETKPPIQEFLSQFVDELNYIPENEVKVNEQCKIEVKIKYSLCDTPARNFIKIQSPTNKLVYHKAGGLSVV
ncbi:unnamed protein product [Psylliodes chrysocephalus]|uniref:Uncharacterized protein n=1 Tax=Psylliodes chrysocephalus TaxID=3402493 RepID=A0A9P0GDU4_9CUCU|nr:unnamed protein product [Psylliodes chrysocephala]